jgi:L-aspartate oxidase
MEFMQFHPTTLSHEQHRNFLITEALRGAGATLRNHQGRRFMRDYDRRLELAPRDVVARSIVREMERLKTWCVYLDATHLEPQALQAEFPTIWSTLRELGIELESDWVPVVPAQHYSCGGVVTDLSGRTTVPGLYASGEVSSTGVHGANRLASNSLLEAIVYSGAAAQAARTEPRSEVPEGAPEPEPTVSEHEAVRIRRSLQAAMSRFAGIFRTDDGLEKAQATVAGLLAEWDEAPKAGFSPYAAETRNLLVTAGHVVGAALARRENVGLHFNADLESNPASPAKSAPSAQTAPSAN